MDWPARDGDRPARTGGDWIDVHHHGYHAELVAALRDAGVTQMAPGVPLPQWTAADSLRVMDSTGISAAVLSLLLPGGAFDHTALSRRANELSAAVAAGHPDRFAVLASLPLPDIDAALSELEYALDILGMAGVALTASLNDGSLLSDPALTPVFDELNRRRAVVFIHLSPAYRCACTGGQGFAAVVPPPAVDFVMDTTRAITGLLYGGTLRRCPDIRFIVAHAGGAVPYLAQRLELWVPPDGGRINPREIAGSLRGLYYETAQSFAPGALACLQAVADNSHVLFGTDYPHMNEAVIASSRQAISEYGRLDLTAVGRDNTLALFPQLGGKAQRRAGDIVTRTRH
jgi:predicted TIM-barrel fold metal-dependent hydrolase